MRSSVNKLNSLLHSYFIDNDFKSNIFRETKKKQMIFYTYIRITDIFHF